VTEIIQFTMSRVQNVNHYPT